MRKVRETKNLVYANDTVEDINVEPLDEYQIDYANILDFYKGLQDAISKNLIIADKSVLSARILAINASTGSLVNCAWWQKQGLDIGGPKKISDTGMEVGNRPNTEYPW
ncbi:unnamed protein product [Diabrotica balteata]|uniref:Uncharacterized protein n=1 Tax=Diabrotica balteata TaxID=107213 RepID=A0A9N9TA26_DIABA|nr:unnamed protein product [Diabrotica balteata]